MTDRRDPQIMALIVELAESSQSAPSYEELEELVIEPVGPEPVRPLRRPKPARTRPAWLVGVVTAVTILIVVGGLAWLLRPATPDSPVVTQLPTPSTTEPPAPTSTGWTRIIDEEAFPLRDGAPGLAPAISSITVGGPGLVAVGSDRTPFGDRQTASTAPTTLPPGAPGDDAAVWTSPDGITWSRVAHNMDVFGGPGDQYMNDVVAGGPGLVAVGEHDPGALVWTSSDGIVWSRVHEESDGARIKAVTVGGPGLVAVGSDDLGAAVWTSSDGIGWTRVPDPSDVFLGATMNDVTETPSGLVAVGGGSAYQRCSSNNKECGAVIWTSPDGFAWTRIYTDDGSDMRAVTTAGPGMIAVGWAGAVWTSSDGLSWLRQPTDEGTFAGAHRLVTVTAGGQGVIVGAQFLFGGPSALWTSADGVTWSRVPDDGIFEWIEPDASGEEFLAFGRINDVLVAQPGLVVVGSAQQNQAALWVRGDD